MYYNMFNESFHTVLLIFGVVTILYYLGQLPSLLDNYIRNYVYSHDTNYLRIAD